MSVRLVGNVVKDGFYHWFQVMGWIKNGSPTSDFNAIPITNTNARRGAIVSIDKKVPEHVSPWILYEYECDQNDSRIKDFNLLKKVDAKPIVYDDSFWNQMQDGLFYLKYTKVKEYLVNESLENAYILKNINDSFVYGVFDGKRNCLEKYDVKDKSLLKVVDRGVFKYGFVCENSLKRNSTKIDCSSSEQLKEWFKNEFELDINRFLAAEPDSFGMEKVRWQRTRGLIEKFILQEDELRGVFERTRNSGFGKIIIEAAKKAIKDDYTKELSDSDETIRALVEKKSIVENEIRSLEEKRKDVEHDIEQEALQRRARFESDLNELSDKRDELEKDCNELSEKKTQKGDEIKELEKQKNLLNAEHARIAEENNKKVDKLEKALQNVKEKYSDLFYDLKVIASEKDDDEEIIFPIYENYEDVDGGEEEWNDIPRSSITNSIKKVCHRAEDCGSCKVYELHVEHDWLHYSDFVNHGLIKIWKEAASNPTIHFILVLDCLNLTRPECGMKPLLDSLECNVPLLGTNLKRPDNLKIMATLLPTEEEGGIGQDISAVIKWPEC
jgi:hypothetical protein